MKKLAVLLLMALLLPLFPGVSPVRAASEPAVLKSSAVGDFPASITFSLSMESNTDITDARLHYSVERLSQARITAEIYLPITPTRQITADWTWDMRKTGGLPPGTVVRYWWSVKDASGEELTTQAESLVFEDDRFDWKYLKKDTVTLYWYKGNDSFAESLLEAAVDGLKKLDETTGIRYTEPVDIHIYADSSSLQSGMIFPQTWTGGVAYSMYSKIAIGITESNLEWGMRTVVHELTHLVVHRMTDNPYTGLPTWLDEGLAMYMEGPLTDTFVYYFEKFKDDNALLSVRSLSSPFSAYADTSYLSYATSYYLVEFLIGQYGQEKMLELLDVFSRGTEYDDALGQVYGFNTDGLNTLFLDYIYGGSLETVKLPVKTTDIRSCSLSPVISFARSR